MMVWAGAAAAEKRSKPATARVVVVTARVPIRKGVFCMAFEAGFGTHAA